MFVIVIALLFAAASAQTTCSGDGQLTANAGSYVFQWSVQPNGMYVDCTVSVNTGANTWVAVGFSENAQMPDTDVYIGANDGTNRFVEDRWNGQSRTAGSLLDPVQNIINATSTRNGARLTISFTRPIDSPDNSTRDEDLNQCRNVLWAFGGTVGTFPTAGNGAASNLGGHSSRGIFSTQLCLCTTSTSGASVGAFVSLFVILVAVLLATGGSML